MDEEKTPTRCEIPDSDKWDLSHLFAEVSKWQEDFGWVERTYRRIAQWKGKIGQSAETLAEVLEFEKELDLKIERLYHFASLQLAEDSSNNEHLARIGQLQNLLTKIGEAVAYVVPEIQAIDEPRWTEFLRDAALVPWRIKLHKIRRMRAHVLSEREERLLALGAVAMNGYDDAFSQLTNVDMKFGVLRDAQGHERPLTQSTYSSFLLKRDGDIRRRAFHQLYEEFQDHQYTLATSLAVDLPRGEEGTVALEFGFEGLPGKHGGPAPTRPDAGHRIVRIAIVAPADVLGLWRLDPLRAVLGHHEFLGRDIGITIIAIRARRERYRVLWTYAWTGRPRSQPVPWPRAYAGGGATATKRKANVAAPFRARAITRRPTSL